MNHDQLQEKIFELCDGELPSGERQEIESHLHDCSDCRAAFDQWRKMATVFFKSESKIESEAFVSRVMANLPSDAKPQTNMFSPFWKLGMASAGLALLLWTFAPVPQTSSVNLETLLLADGRPSAESVWIFRDRAVQADEMMSYAWEEQ